MSEFTSMYNWKNVIKQKTCFKSPENPYRDLKMSFK